MKQTLQVIAKANTKKITAKIPEAMPTVKYMISMSIMGLTEEDKPLYHGIYMDVPADTKKVDSFVITFSEKLPKKTLIEFHVEMPT